MKPARSYANVMRRWYRAVEHECPVCQRRLRQAMALPGMTYGLDIVLLVGRLHLW